MSPAEHDSLDEAAERKVLGDVIHGLKAVLVELKIDLLR